MNTMARKPLSPEEIAQLRSSPYVEGVIEERISFTPEFKRMAYDQLVRGKTMREILDEHGINPQILGNRRIWGLAATIRENAEREEGFADLRENNKRLPAKGTEEQALLARIAQLEHKLAYTQQEVEFLKKIQTANSEAQKSWESKQHRK